MKIFKITIEKSIAMSDRVYTKTFFTKADSIWDCQKELPYDICGYDNGKNEIIHKHNWTIFSCKKNPKFKPNKANVNNSKIVIKRDYPIDIYIKELDYSSFADINSAIQSYEDRISTD